MRWISDWKGCKFSRVVETVGFDDFFKEFNKWCNIHHMCTLKMFIPSLAWKDLFNYLEGPSIKKYHHETKFKTYRSQIGICDIEDENQIKDLPICFATLRGFLSTSTQKYFCGLNY
jgi:hypothetical protein